MPSCCSRVTVAAVAVADTSTADHPFVRRPPSLVNYPRSDHRQSLQGRGAGWATLRTRRWVISAAVSRRGEEEEDNDETKVRPGLPPGCFSFDPDAVVVPKKGADRRVDVMVVAAVTVVLGVGNQVLYKLALVPLKHYLFFLAQLTTFA